jgi:hypothetical protein
MLVTPEQLRQETRLRRFLGRLTPEERHALHAAAGEQAATITDEDRERNRAFARRFLGALTQAMLSARRVKP